jgi:hypothetical protein
MLDAEMAGPVAPGEAMPLDVEKDASRSGDASMSPDDRTIEGGRLSGEKCRASVESKKEATV